jgi:hypothetical protein
MSRFNVGFSTVEGSGSNETFVPLSKKQSMQRRLGEQVYKTRLRPGDIPSSPTKTTKDFGEIMRKQSKGLEKMRQKEDKVAKINLKRSFMAKQLEEGIKKYDRGSELRAKEEQQKKQELELQKEKDVVDLWNEFVDFIIADPDFINKEKLPMKFKKKLADYIEKTYNYIAETGTITKKHTFNYYDKFLPSSIRKWDEQTSIINPTVDFRILFKEEPVGHIESIFLKVRNVLTSDHPTHYYWLRLNENKSYESFYTFKPNSALHKEILKSNENRNKKLTERLQQSHQSAHGKRASKRKGARRSRSKSRSKSRSRSRSKSRR